VTEKGLAARAGELRAGLRDLDPARIAARSGAGFFRTGENQGEFRLAVWQQPVVVTFPGFVVIDAAQREPLADPAQALVLYYFVTCDGAPAAGQWISFADLPDGRFYNQAFQGYTGKPVAQAFGQDIAAFRAAAQALGGMEYPLGEAAFCFQALPHVPLLAVYWLGDEDFPPACQILFDAAASHHLPTDACAILGSTLARRLVKKKD
jgi:hypothetical protein